MKIRKTRRKRKIVKKDLPYKIKDSQPSDITIIEDDF